MVATILPESISDFFGPDQMWLVVGVSVLGYADDPSVNDSVVMPTPLHCCERGHTDDTCAVVSLVISGIYAFWFTSARERALASSAKLAHLSV
jgi:hypothetical protein